MSGYVVAPQAWTDLIDVQLYLLEERPDAVDHVMRGLRRGMDFVAAHPGAGRARVFGGRELRIWTVWSWVIVYNPSADPLEIVRVLHGARDIDDAFD